MAMRPNLARSAITGPRVIGKYAHEPRSGFQYLLNKRYARTRQYQFLKCDGHSSQKDICLILIVSDPCSERIPDVLVTWDNSDSRSDCKIIESLNSALVFYRLHTCCERRNIILQVVAEFIPIPSDPEAIVLPRIVETMGN